jgi:hypothetical protein
VHTGVLQLRLPVQPRVLAACVGCQSLRARPLVLAPPLPPQASLSVTVLFASYIAQQRLRPFVAAESLSSGLQVSGPCVGVCARHARVGLLQAMAD